MFPNHGSPTRVTRLNVAPNMAVPTSKEHSVNSLWTCSLNYIYDRGHWEHFGTPSSPRQDINAYDEYREHESIKIKTGSLHIPALKVIELTQL